MRCRPTLYLAFLFLMLTLAPVLAAERFSPPAGQRPIAIVSKTGVTIHVSGGYLGVQPVGDGIIRVVYAKNPAFFAHRGFMMAPDLSSRPKWTVVRSKN